MICRKSRLTGDKTNAIEVLDAMGDTDAVMSILNSKALPSRPTRPIKNHRKEGDAVRWYQKVGFNLVVHKKDFTVRSPEDVIPEGVEHVRIECSLETIELPPSVISLLIAERAHLENVPAIWQLTVLGTVGTLSPNITGIVLATGTTLPREKLERVTGLREYMTSLVDDRRLWFPPWLSHLQTGVVDPICLAESSLASLTTNSIEGLTLPPTLRSLTITDHDGSPLPDTLEELEIGDPVAKNPESIREFPRGLIKLVISDIPISGPLPTSLHVFEARGLDLSGVVLPESLRILELFRCKNIPPYPNSLCRLTIVNATNIPPIPRSVFTACFCDCMACPGVFRNVTSLETLILRRCDESFQNIPTCVTDLEVEKTPIMSSPPTLVSLTCEKHEDFDEDRVMSKLRLDMFWDCETTSEYARFTMPIILNLNRLRWLHFVD